MQDFLKTFVIFLFAFGLLFPGSVFPAFGAESEIIPIDGSPIGCPASFHGNPLVDSGNYSSRHKENYTLYYDLICNYENPDYIPYKTEDEPHVFGIVLSYGTGDFRFFDTGDYCSGKYIQKNGYDAKYWSTEIVGGISVSSTDDLSQWEQEGAYDIKESLLWGIENLLVPLEKMGSPATKCPGVSSTPIIEEEPVVEKEKPPIIIFLPGVAGSYLSLDQIGPDPNVWPLSIASEEYMFFDENGSPKHTLVIGDILRSDVTSKLNFYGGMMDFIETLPNYTGKDEWFCFDCDIKYEEGTDLFAFPYDWRMPLTPVTIQLGNFVDEKLEETGRTKVILIAHSMGGLIARNYAANIGNDKVEMLISIGSPFKGATKPMYSVTNGYNFDNDLVDKLMMKMASQNIPAVYHLLPQYQVIATGEKTPDGDQITNEYFYRNLWYKSLDDEVTDGYFSKETYHEFDTNDWQANQLLIKKANEFHKVMGPLEQKIPNVKHYAIIGTGLETLYQYKIHYSSDYKDPSLEKFVELPKGYSVKLIPIMADGDGTVPIQSSDIKGVDKTYYIEEGIKGGAGHGGLPANTEVQKIVKSLLSGNPLDDKNYGKSNQPKVNEGNYFSEWVIPEVFHDDNLIEGSSTSRASSSVSVTTDSTSSESSTPPAEKIIKFDKTTVKVKKSQPDSIRLSGELENPTRGQPFIFKLIKPDGTTEEFASVVTGKGKFANEIIVDNSWKSGEYTIEGFYQGEKIESNTFEVQAEFAEKVPTWIKNNAKWWADGLIGDSDFTSGIQHLIKEKIITITNAPAQSTATGETKVPDWIKNNAGWWADGLISEDDFLKGIEYLVKNGIIRTG